MRRGRDHQPFRTYVRYGDRARRPAGAPTHWSAQVKRLLRAALAVVVAVVVLAAGMPPAHARPVADRQCGTARLAVSLAPGQPASQHVVVEHCQPHRWSAVRALDVFTDGAGYTRYWDWPAQRR